ncbi:hypothetical protein LOTGIDRAFT_234526 [Lottia gigantea]|uniref:Uncharacterized protein n=1 Tax=Lottia gigantea TaxID=225164 RepID=V3ZVT7_LOTGI|nr:hypothetical protein LOTGIDRAFT_234526 [Lottia gigantea]ESO88472.1 hypothetical protein LOTGIDRAFT_234526 [Lottia gigantea]
MDILFASVLLVLSASTVSGWGIPQPQRTIFPNFQPDFQQPPNTDPWGVPNRNPGRQTFPVPQPNTDPWWVQDTNPGRQTFPQPQQPSIFPLQPIQFPFGNPGGQQPQQQGNQCQILASSGDCRFYDCFNQVEQQCLFQGQFLVNDMQSLCQGAQRLSGRFSFQGQQYLQKVSKCAAKQMTSVVNSQSCNAIDFQAASTLFGQSTGEDCYWQNQLFCNVVSNPQDSQALVAILFGGNAPYNPQFIKVAEHLQVIVTSCSQSVQNTFQNNFTNRCPIGTVGRQNQPVVFPNQPMMMGGAGGD